MYQIDGKNLSDYGVSPVKNDEAIALAGVMSLPKRTDTTEYDWGTSIEPFVDAEDIELDGRKLTLGASIKSDKDLLLKLSTFMDACVACKSLGTDFGTFQVIQKDEITVTKYLGIVILSIPFWQQDYLIATNDIVPSNSGDYMLDKYDLKKDFGISMSSSNGIDNTPGRIDVSTTLPYRTTTYRTARDLSLSCKMLGESLTDLYKKITKFEALCISPGTHQIKCKNVSRTIYFKDGIDVKVEADTVLSFDLKCRVIK
jgi:hypothetical protein